MEMRVCLGLFVGFYIVIYRGKLRDWDWDFTFWVWSDWLVGFFLVFWFLMIEDSRRGFVEL